MQLHCNIKDWTEASIASNTLSTCTTLRLQSSTSSVLLSLFEIHVFISSPHVYITYTSLSCWELGGIVWHQLPPFNTCAPSHQDHIPPSSWRKYTHLPRSQIPAMFSGNITLCFREPPLRRLEQPPTRAKMLQIIEGANTEVFLLTPDRYCQDVNGRQSYVTQGGLWGFQRCISSGWIGRVTSAMCWHHALLNIH